MKNNNDDKITTGMFTLILSVAEQSVRHGLDFGKPMQLAGPGASGRRVTVDTSLYGGYSSALRRKGASFITVTHTEQLRGCIGTLIPYRPLAIDVVANAYAAAFNDPRFPPLQTSEWSKLALSVSVLSRAVELPVNNEANLLARLKPGIDGLILTEGNHRVTFLPQVWEHLSEPADFLSQLKCKAGLDEDYWSDSLRFFRYTTQSYGRLVDSPHVYESAVEKDS